VAQAQLVQQMLTALLVAVGVVEFFLVLAVQRYQPLLLLFLGVMVVAQVVAAQFLLGKGQLFHQELEVQQTILVALQVLMVLLLAVEEAGVQVVAMEVMTLLEHLSLTHHLELAVELFN
jgi:hypothetical protein